jgi:uncharacterized Ntn-hydrolase superfamily protein
MMQSESIKIYNSKGRMVQLPEISIVKNTYPVELRIDHATEEIADTYNIFVIYAISNKLSGAT